LDNKELHKFEDDIKCML